MRRAGQNADLWLLGGLQIRHYGKNLSECDFAYVRLFAVSFAVRFYCWELQTDSSVEPTDRPGRECTEIIVVDVKLGGRGLGWSPPVRPPHCLQ